MIAMRLLPLAAVLFVHCMAGVDAKRTTFERNLVTYIDYKKYLENESQHFQIRKTTTTTTTTAAPSYDEPTCADPENEVYQECGNKCVLGCRYANTTADIGVSKKDCDKNDCVAGCFCKAGLIRHQSRCIPAKECPIQKCYRGEVYQCVSAMLITCEDLFRQEERAERTEDLDCVWGCHCPKGYLRNNNGQCVQWANCNNVQNVQVPPQIITNVFPFRHLFRPPYSNGGGCCGCNGGGCGGNSPGHNIEIFNQNLADREGSYGGYGGANSGQNGGANGGANGNPVNNYYNNYGGQSGNGGGNGNGNGSGGPQYIPVYFVPSLNNNNDNNDNNSNNNNNNNNNNPLLG